MDFFFAYNINHINFEGVITRYEPSVKSWKVVKNALLSFTWNFQKEKICINFQAFKKKNVMVQIHNVIFQQNSGCTFLFKIKDQNKLYGFSFKQEQSFFQFKGFLSFFVSIQKEIEQFQNEESQYKNLITKISNIQNEYYPNGYDVLPFCLLYQNNQQFQQFFEENFIQNLKTILQNHQLEESFVMFQNFANIFKFSQKNFLKSILTTQQRFKFVQQVVDLFLGVKQSYMGFENQYSNEKSCQFLNIPDEVKNLITQNEKIYFENLQFLINNCLVYFFDEKYLQLYVSILQKQKIKIYKQIINKQQNVQNISFQINNNKFTYFDFALDLLHTFYQEQNEFCKTINFLNSIHFMDFIRRILVKIRFEVDQQKLIAKINTDKFKQENQFIKFIEFTCLFIRKNPSCFVTQVFHQNQRCEHFRSLKQIVLMYFQDSYIYSEQISLETILNVVKNIYKLQPDEQSDYLETMGDIIKSIINQYPFLKNDIRFFKLIECLIRNKELIVLKRILLDQDIQKVFLQQLTYQKQKINQLYACKIVNFILHHKFLKDNLGVEIYHLVKCVEKRKFRKLNMIQREFRILKINLDNCLKECYQLIQFKFNLNFLQLQMNDNLTNFLVDTNYLKKSFIITEELFQKYEYSDIKKILDNVYQQIEKQFSEMRLIQRKNDSMFYDIQNNIAYIKNQIEEKKQFATLLTEQFKQLSLCQQNYKQNNAKKNQNLNDLFKRHEQNKQEQINDIFIYVDQLQQLIQNFESKSLMKINEEIFILLDLCTQKQNQYTKQLHQLFDIDNEDDPSYITKKIIDFFFQDTYENQHFIKIISFIYNTQNINNQKFENQHDQNIYVQIQKGIQLFIQETLCFILLKFDKFNIQQNDFYKIQKFMQDIDQTNIIKVKNIKNHLEKINQVIHQKKREFFYKNLDQIIDFNDKKQNKYVFDQKDQLTLKDFLDNINKDSFLLDILSQYLQERIEMDVYKYLSITQKLKLLIIYDLIIEYTQIDSILDDKQIQYLLENQNKQNLQQLEVFIQNINLNIFNYDLINKVLQKYYIKISQKSIQNLQYIQYPNVFCKKINKDIQGKEKFTPLDSMLEKYSTFNINQSIKM